jgi:hypothetical protein
VTDGERTIEGMKGRVDTNAVRRNGMFTVQRGALLCERLCLTSAAVTQTDNRKAPERAGYWAFPWPHFDLYYAYHQYQAVLPKALRSEQDPGWHAVRAWIDKHGETTVRRRRFWWNGPIWSPIAPDGRNHDVWFCHSDAASYTKAIARALGPGGIYGYYRGIFDGELGLTRWGVDHLLEVFLPTDKGRVVPSPYDSK